MKKRLKLFSKTSFLTVLLLVFISPVIAQTLSVGMQAPSIKVGSWVKGGPIEDFKPGQIYVVEFWGTWCKPCMSVIPMLTSYAEKYKGKVNVIGVSVYEQNTSNVAPFVKKMGDKMNYHVAIDLQESPTAKEGYMSKNWVAAVKESGLPLTFVVGKTGKIEYIGGADLRSVLPQIIAGTWATISDKEWLHSPLGAKRSKIKELLWKKETYEEALKDLDNYGSMEGEGRDLYPKAWSLAQKTLVYMWMGRSKEFHRTAKYLYKTYKTVPANYIGWGSGDRTMVLNNVIVWPIVDPKREASRTITATKKDYRFALKVAKHMVAFNPEDINALDSKAWAYYRVGKFGKARKIFERIKARFPEDKDFAASYNLFKSKIKK